MKNKSKVNKNKFQDEEEDYELEESELNEEFEEDSNEEENEENSEDGNEEESLIESADDDSEAEIYHKENIEKENTEAENLEDFKPTGEEIKEFNSNMNTLHTAFEELNKKVNGLLINIKTPGKAEMKYGISYLDGKSNIMLSYLINLIFYSLNKTSGKSIKNHELLKKLVYCKTILERSKVIDLKLKSQIERLLKLGEKDLKEFEENKETRVKSDQNENNFRPRILDQEDEENSQEEDAIDDSENLKDENEKKKLKYKVQKNFSEFFETKDENKARHKKILKMKEKIRGSEYYNELKDSFMETPKEIHSKNTEYEKFMTQVEDYENENFTRVKINKREMKMIKKKDKKDNDFDDIGKEFKNFDRILKNETEEEFHDENKFLGMKRMGSGPSGRGDRGRGRGRGDRGRGDRGRSRGDRGRGRGSFGGRGRKSF